MTERKRNNLENKIVAFLNEHTCISVRCIEEKTGIGQGTITKVIKETKGRSLTATNIEKLIPVLKLYGFKS